MKLDNAYKYYSKLSALEKVLYQKRIYNFLSNLAKQYPHFYEWYFNLFYFNGILKSDREIIFCEKYGIICGVIILKKQLYEKKICTLRVSRYFQHQGIGTNLLEMGLEWLKCDKPLITVNKRIMPQYKKIFKYFGFVEVDRKWAYYSVFSSEYAYNGLLDVRPRIIETVEFSLLESFIDKLIKENTRPSAQDYRKAMKKIEELNDLYLEHCNSFAY